MNKVCFIFFILICISLNTNSQGNVLDYNIGALGGYISGDHVPFWLRANQFGSTPETGLSLSLIGAVRKEYETDKNRFFDWGASVEGRLNIGKKANFTLIEGYGKIRLSIFELRAGRSKEIMGLCDTGLSSGSFSISGNNLGIPKVQVSIPELWTIPGLGQLFAIKGNYAHGWIGNVPMRQQTGDTIWNNTFFHQKSFYGRFGNPAWRLKLYGGFSHQVLWGNEQNYYNDDFTLSPITTYLYVITGKTFSNGTIQETRIGDHLGSIDIGFEYEFDRIKVLIYRQNFYDAGALAHLANIQDGLNGISLENKRDDGEPAVLKKILFEFLYTKNQAGESWSPPTPTAYESYYNHYQYINGWSFNGIGLGTPFIGTRADIRDELPSSPNEYFINNRVTAAHIGCEGSLARLNYIFKISYSWNYGTYRTTDEEQSTGIGDPGAYGVFGLQRQLSTYFKFGKELKNGFNLNCITALDTGELYYNSFGLFLSISKSL